MFANDRSKTETHKNAEVNQDVAPVIEAVAQAICWVNESEAEEATKQIQGQAIAGMVKISVDSKGSISE